MPTYEYECTQCGYRFEASQKMTDAALDTCPKCNKRVRRLISSGVGVIFKGAGFYATDYRKKEKKETNKREMNTCPKAKEGCNACQRIV